MQGVNWGQHIKESSDEFETIEVGQYACVVEKSEATMSSTNKLMFKVQYKIVSGPRTGRIIFNNVVFSPDNPRAKYFFFENLEAMGVKREVLEKNNPAPEVVAQMMLGQSVLVTIDHRDYQGKARENVKSLAPGAGGGAGPVPGGGGFGGPAGLPAPAAQAPAVSGPAPTPQVSTPPATPAVQEAPAAAAPAAPQESTEPIPTPSQPAQADTTTTAAAPPPPF